VLPTDLSDRTARASLLERVVELGLTPEILVNNAGFSTTGPVARSDPAAEMMMIEVDVVAVARPVQAGSCPEWSSRGRGAIPHVASTGPSKPLPGRRRYAPARRSSCPTRHSLIGELRRTGVTATALCPGPVHTEFAAAAGLTREQSESALPGSCGKPPSLWPRPGVSALAKGRAVAIPGRSTWRAPCRSLHAAAVSGAYVLASRHPSLPKVTAHLSASLRFDFPTAQNPARSPLRDVSGDLRKQLSLLARRPQRRLGPRPAAHRSRSSP